MNCAQVKILETPFRSQCALSAHPSPLEIGVLSGSLSVAPPGSPTSPNMSGCVVRGPTYCYYLYRIRPTIRTARARRPACPLEGGLVSGWVGVRSVDRTRMLLRIAWLHGHHQRSDRT